MTSETPSYFGPLYYNFRRNSPLPIESSYVLNVSFIVPSRFSSGTYNVSVRTDRRRQVFELGRTANNLRWILIRILERYCDLVITNADHSVMTSSRGNRIYFHYRVENQGRGPTLEYYWSDRVGISSSRLSNIAGTQLIRFTQTSILSVGQAYSYNSTLYVPQHINGILFIRLEVDYNMQIAEENDANNVFVIGPLDLPPIYPDLAVQSLRLVTSGTIFGGSMLEVQWTVQNSGEGVIEGFYWHDSLYLTSLPSYEHILGDIVISSSGNLVLEPNATYTERIPVSIPVDLDYSSVHYIRLHTNSDFRVRENGRDQNNYAELEIPILPPPSPDLTVTRINFTYLSVNRILSVNWEVQNEGNSMPNELSWIDQIFISSRSEFSTTSSFSLGQRTQQLRMYSGQTYIFRESFLLPSTFNGLFYVFVYTDSARNVRELDGENNNILKSHSSFDVAQLPRAVLTVNIHTESLPLEYLTGQTFMVNYTVVNTGEVDLQTSSWVDGIYLSGISFPSRTYLFTDGLPLSEILNTMELVRGDSYTAGASVTLLHNLRRRLYLTILLDKNMALDAAVAGMTGIVINIQQGPLPDLMLSDISVEQNITSGQPTFVNFTVTNVGEATARRFWYTSLILSADAELDPFDTRLITVRNPQTVANDGLMVNDSYYRSIEVSIPYDLPTAYYYLFVILDTRNDLAEEVERDGSNIGTFLLHITETVSTNIAVLNVQINSTNVTYGDSLRYSYSLRNLGELQARGYKCDSIYLSKDDNWDIEDFEIGIPLCRSVTLNAYEQNTRNDLIQSRRAVVPFIAHGGYYGLVRTRTNIRDPDLSDNTAATPELVKINAPILVLGQKTRITLTPGDTRLYQTQGVIGGQSLVATLSTEEENIYHDLFLRFRDAPTGAEHDAFSQFSLSPNQRAVVRNTIYGTYYILIESFTSTDLMSSYTTDILVRIAQFEVESVSPSMAAPLGNVTLKFTGTLISYFSKAVLLDSSHDPILEPSRVYWFNSETLYATFDITGMELGQYSLRVFDEMDGKSAQLNNSFTIIRGVPGRLAMYLQIPRPLLAGEIGEVIVRLENIGNTDILSPYLIMKSNNRNVHFKLLDNSGPIDFASTIHFLGLPLEGPGGILAPGKHTQTTFKIALTSGRMATVLITVEHQNDMNGPHPYLARKEQLRSISVPVEIWEKVWENFIKSVGTTRGSMLRRLSEIATELSLVRKKVYSIDELIMYQLRVSYGLLSGKNLCIYFSVCHTILYV